VHVPLDGPRFPALRRQAEATMDRATLTVFGDLLDGDMHRARRASVAYEACLVAAVAAGRIREIPGARAAIEMLRAEGLAVALVCGFGPETRDAVIAALGWTGIVDAVLSPCDADGRGLPDPALVLGAARRTEVELPDAVVAGDASAGILAAVRAGAGLAVGVRSGAHSEPVLRRAGAHAVIDSVADLPALLGLPG
jgi:phosphonatase-like hydrolase